MIQPPNTQRAFRGVRVVILLATLASLSFKTLRAQDLPAAPAAMPTAAKSSPHMGDADAVLQSLREIYRSRPKGRNDEAAPFRLEYAWDQSYDNNRTEITAFALSPDAHYLCTANSNRKRGWLGFGPSVPKKKGRFATARLWDLHTGREVRRFVGHEDCIECTSVAFSPNGKLLVSCAHVRLNHGEETRLWDTQTGEELAHWKGIGSTAVFTDDGSRIVVLSYDGVSLIDLASRKTLKGFRLREPDSFSPIAFDVPPVILADGRSALFIYDGRVAQFDLQEGSVTRWFGKRYSADHPYEVLRFALSDDDRLMVTSYENCAVVWDFESGREIRRLELDDQDYLGDCLFTPDGQFVVTKGEEKRCIWRLEDGEIVQQDKIGEGRLVASPDDRFLILANACHFDLVEGSSGVHLARFHQFEQDRHWLTETIDGRYAASKEYSTFTALSLDFEEVGLKPDAERVAAVLGILTREASKPSVGSQQSQIVVELKSLRVFPHSADIRVDVRGAADKLRGEDVHVLVDGKPVLLAGASGSIVEGNSVGTSRMEMSVRLPTGRNEIRVEAYVVAADGVRSETAAIMLHPSASSGEAGGRLFVLAVGVSEYKYPEYNLRFAHNDAQALAEFFRNQKGRIYSDVVVQVYTDREANQENLRKGLNWLKRSCTPDDGAIVFFAGHGIRGRRGLYFVTHEGDEEGIHYTCLNWSEVAERLAETEAGQILLLSDCCHAGAFGIQRLATQDELAEKIAEKAEIVFFASCRPQEQSLEDARWKHGAFTHALLEGLGGKADSGKRDGHITLEELYSYVRSRVSDMTSGDQTPEIPDFESVDKKRIIAASPR